MNSQNENELTTTLRLGGSPSEEKTSPLLSEFLESVSESEQETVDQILNGSPDKAMLIIHRGPAKGSRYLITTDGCTVGRSHESEVFLDDVTVSRKHAVISFLSGESLFEIVDSSSLNGTYVNSVSIDRSTLTSGDQIQVGKFHLVFITGKSRLIGEK
jgi:FHA domain